MSKVSKSTSETRKSVTHVASRVGPATVNLADCGSLEGAAEVRFGRVIVKAVTPSAERARLNIAEGHLALGRAKTVLLNPGVFVHVSSDTPLFHADPATPGVLVRTLNGSKTRGRFVGGRFKPI